MTEYPEIMKLSLASKYTGRTAWQLRALMYSGLLPYMKSKGQGNFKQKHAWLKRSDLDKHKLGSDLQLVKVAKI